LLQPEFRSLWVTKHASPDTASRTTVFNVSPLLRTLIVEAASLGKTSEPEYAGRVTALILDQLRRARPVPSALPESSALCGALYADPTDPRSVDKWSQKLGRSSRTLTRRFEREVGITMRTWRRRLFKAIELLGGGLAITQIALDDGGTCWMTASVAPLRSSNSYPQSSPQRCFSAALP
jgi:AraC-like DNA-binding protein